jgi:hypothetical protein
MNGRKRWQRNGREDKYLNFFLKKVADERIPSILIHFWTSFVCRVILVPRRRNKIHSTFSLLGVNLRYTNVNSLQENQRNHFVWETLKNFKFGGLFWRTTKLKSQVFLSLVSFQVMFDFYPRHLLSFNFFEFHHELWIKFVKCLQLIQETTKKKRCNCE